MAEVLVDADVRFGVRGQPLLRAIHGGSGDDGVGGTAAPEHGRADLLELGIPSMDARGDEPRQRNRRGEPVGREAVELKRQGGAL